MNRLFLILASAAAAALSACASQDGAMRGRNASLAANMEGAADLGAAGPAADNSEAGRRNALLRQGVDPLSRFSVNRYMDRQQDELVRELTGAGVGVARKGDALVLSMPNDATFDIDDADIQTPFRAVLDRVAQVLNRYPQTLVDVAGHADSTGADDHNQTLSERRAASVAVYLVDSDQVLPSRLFVVGRGESQPIASNDTPEGRAANRRVDILIRPFTADVG